MLRRTLAALFGGLTFGILAPLGWVLAFGFGNVLWAALAGVLLGAALGARFPTAFGFVFEMFLELGD